MTQGSKRHALQALPGVALPGLASFLGMVAVQRVAGPRILGLVSLTWITAVFGSAIIAFGASQAALRAIATDREDLVALHRWLLLRRAAVVAPATAVLGGILALAGRSLGLPLILGSIWMVAQGFVLFESEVFKARRDFRSSSGLLVARALVGWTLTVTGAALTHELVGAVLPQIAVTAVLVILLRPRVRHDAPAAEVAVASGIAAPSGRLAVASYALGYGDRYILDLLLGPVAVGIYTLGYQLGEGALELVSGPISSALLPRVVREWAAGDHDEAWRTVRRGELAVLSASVAALPVVLVTDRAGLLDLVSPSPHLPTIVSLIAIAVGIQGTTKLSYGLLLAQGRAAAANRCFWQVVVLSAVTVPILTARFEIVGTAVATVLGYGALAILMRKEARRG